jgi:protease I
MAAKKILIVTGDAGESYEALYAKHRMAEAGHTPVIAAPRTGPLHLVMHDFEPGWDTYVERPGYRLSADLTFKEVKVADYAAVILLGGRAPEYLRNDATLLRLVREFADANKFVFSICHGIQILVAAGLAEGRKLTCYEHVKTEVTAAGGEWIGQEAVRDGRFVSAQTWVSHPDFYRHVMQCLDGR